MDHKEVLYEIKSHLKDYLEEHEMFNSSGKVTCPFNERHTHGDKNPSASIVPDNPHLLHCFGCSESWDIFTIAHKLEGLPIRGTEFWTVTVKKLASKYNIEYTPSIWNDDNRESFFRKRFYKDISTYLKLHTPKSIFDYLEERSWDVEVSKELGLGGIKSRKHIVEWLKDRGWNNTDIKKYGFYNANIFMEDNLIFPINNKYGQTIAFVARYVEWKKGSSRPKYINSSASVIYKKSKTLYGYDRALKEGTKDKIYIVEGYGDFVRLYSMGLRNVAALGGVAFSEEHIDMIEHDGYREIILMYDGDKAGEDSALGMAEVLQKYKNIKSTIISLKNYDDSGNADPDTYFKDKNLDMLDKITEDREEIYLFYCRDIINKESEVDALRIITKYIAGFSSSIDRMKISANVSERFGLNHDVIIEEVKSLVSEVEEAKKEAENKIKEELVWKLRGRKPFNIMEVLVESVNRLKKIDHHGIVPQGDLSSETMSCIASTEEIFMGGKEVVMSPLPSFRKLSNTIEGGIPMESYWITLGGASGAGKSMHARQMAIDLLESGRSVMYISIDEGKMRTFRCLLSAHSNVPLSIIRNPAYMDHIKINEDMNIDKLNIKDIQNELKMRVSNSFQYFSEMGSNGRFYLGSNATTVPAIDLAIEKALSKNDDLILMIDSFQQIQTSEEGVSGFMKAAQDLKNIINLYDIPLIITSELKKSASNTKPTLSDLSETRKLEHLSDLVIMAWNKQKTNPNDRTAKVILDTTNDNILDTIGVRRECNIIDYLLLKNRDKGIYCNYRSLIQPWSTKLQEYDWDESIVEPQQEVQNIYRVKDSSVL